ncbi:MAG: hypothetical protein C0608_11245 [Deltaproteobacteria bacterium]|nr:MAG: hypothetical protein C0608_11245 [Deltaproteobacteria bacterium]
MNRFFKVAMIGAIALMLAGTGFAKGGSGGGDMGGSSMGGGMSHGEQSMDMAKDHAMEMDRDMKMDHDMDHSDHKGEMIHQSMANHHQLAYHLINNKEQMEAMKDMKGMSMSGGAAQMKSHHLMVYPVDDAGNPLTGSKTGYLVTSPSGAKQKAMAMEMKGGYGADVDFSEKGTYKVTVKIVKGDTQIVDNFDYDVK